MADNTRINPGAAGDIVRTIDRGGSKTQVVALDLTPGGSAETLMGLGASLDDSLGPLILLELRRISTLLSIMVGTTVTDTEIFTESGY